MGDILEYGMKNRKSDSIRKRILAEGVLMAEKKKADLYEAWLEKQDIPVPEELMSDEAFLKKILEEIEKDEQ